MAHHSTLIKLHCVPCHGAFWFKSHSHASRSPFSKGTAASAGSRQGSQAAEATGSQEAVFVMSSDDCHPPVEEKNVRSGSIDAHWGGHGNQKAQQWSHRSARFERGSRSMKKVTSTKRSWISFSRCRVACLWNGHKANVGDPRNLSWVCADCGRFVVVHGRRSHFATLEESCMANTWQKATISEPETRHTVL